MPAEVTLHLHFPTHDKEVVVKKKLALNGTYVDDRAAIAVPLRPGMNHHASTVKLSPSLMAQLAKECANAEPSGEIIHINAEKGEQLKVTNERGFTGPDGRYNHASKIKQDAQDLQAGREAPRSERFVIWMGVAILALIVALVLVALA